MLILSDIQHIDIFEKVKNIFFFFVKDVSVHFNVCSKNYVSSKL